MFLWWLFTTCLMANVLCSYERVEFQRDSIPVDSNGDSAKRGVVKLPTISEIIALNTKSSFSVGSCIIDLGISKTLYSLTPQSACKGKLTLETLLNHFFPNNNIASRTKSFFLPAKFSLDALTIDKATSQVSFAATSTERFEIIPRKLSLDSSEIELSFNYRSGNMAWEKLQLTIKGTFKAGGKDLSVDLKKEAESSDISLTFEIPQISVPDFTKLFTNKQLNGKNLAYGAVNSNFNSDEQPHQSVGIADAYSQLEACARKFESEFNDVSKRSDDVNTEEVTGVVIQKLKVSGVYNPEGSFEIIGSGLPQTRLFKGSVYVIVQQKAQGAAGVGFLASMEGINPAQIISKFIKKDLSNMPLLKDITLNFATTVASQAITEIKNEELRNALASFGGEGKELDQGAVLKMELPVKEIITKVSPKTDVSDVPQTLFVKIIIQNGQVKFDFPKTWKTDLLRIASAVTPQAVNLLPDWLRGKGKPSVDVDELNFDYKTMAFTIGVKAKGPIQIKDIFSLENIDIKVIYKHNDNDFDLELASNQKILNKIDLKTSLKKEGKEYTLEGEINEISTGQISEWMNTKFAAPDIIQKYSFLNFGIEDFKLRAKFGGEDTKIQISGNAVLFGMKGLKAEGIVHKKGAATTFAVGITLQRVSLADLVQNIFKKQISFAHIMSELNVGMVISLMDSTEDTFTLPELKDMGVKKGFQFRATFKPPSDCRREKLCEKGKEILGNGQKSLVLEGSIDTSGATLIAKYNGNWTPSNKVTVNDIFLKVVIAATTQVEIGVGLTVDVGSKLDLRGSIAINTAGELKLTAALEKGAWERPFGLQYVAFSGVKLSVGIYITTGLPTLEFQATIKVGKIGSGKEITIQGGIGVDPIVVTNSYFYGSIDRATIEAVAQAFGYTNLNMPKVLSGSGFPKGVTVAFSMGKEITIKNIKIQQGFGIEGLFRLQNLIDLDTRIVVNFPKSIEVRVQMSPLKLGVLDVLKSRADRRSGPLFHVTIDGSKVGVEIQGFVSILKIEAEVAIKVTDTSFEFSIRGRILDLIGASLEVKASYASFDSLSFMIRGCLEGAKSQVESEFERIKKEETSAMEAAYKKAQILMKELRAMERREFQLFARAYQSEDVCYQRFRKELMAYKEGRSPSKFNCTERCSRGCLGGCDWKPSCVKVEGKSVGCPRWNGCRFQALDEVCFAKCKHDEYLQLVKNDGRRKRRAAEGEVVTGPIIRRGSPRLSRQPAIRRPPSRTPPSRTPPSRTPPSRTPPSRTPPSRTPPSRTPPSRTPPSRTPPSRTPPSTPTPTPPRKPSVGERITDGARRLGKYTKEKLAKIKSMIMTFESACFEAELNRVQQKACLRFTVKVRFAKLGAKTYNPEVCLDSGFFRNIGRSLFDKAVEPLMELRGAAYDVEYLSEKLRKLNAERVKEYGDVLQESSVGEEDNGASGLKREQIWDAENGKAMQTKAEQLQAFATYQTYYPSQEGKHRTASEEANKETIGHQTEDSSDSVRKSISLDLQDKSPCELYSRMVKGFHDLTSALRHVVDHFDTEKHSFHTTKKGEVKRLDEMESMFKANCQTYGCSKEELNDSMYLIDSARANNDKWANVVEDQLQGQDEESIQSLRRSLDDIYQEKKGQDLRSYVAALDEMGSNSAKRMEVPSEDGKDPKESVQVIIQGLRDVLLNEEKVRISDVAGTVREMVPHLRVIQASTPKDCKKSGIVSK